jgi:hypothetical protein
MGDHGPHGGPPYVTPILRAGGECRFLQARAPRWVTVPLDPPGALRHILRGALTVGCGAGVALGAAGTTGRGAAGGATAGRGAPLIDMSPRPTALPLSTDGAVPIIICAGRAGPGRPRAVRRLALTRLGLGTASHPPPTLRVTVAACTPRGSLEGIRINPPESSAPSASLRLSSCSSRGGS